MALIFWGSVAFIVYAYAGYPLLLLLIGTVRRRRIRRGPITPAVSYIIAARNEESRIGEKLESTLRLDYPQERLEVIVASDCSDDRTDEIVGSYAGRGVRLVRAPARLGKEATQKLALAAACGEILVFSDVATIVEPGGVRAIVQSFLDPTVGCVSSKDCVLGEGGHANGEGAYVQYEMLLRTLETRVGSLVGLSGSFFAVRRQVCHEWVSDLPSDFNTVLAAVRLGLRAVSDPDSIGYYRSIANPSREFDRKVRTVLRGISTLMRGASLLNPLRYGLFSWQLFSHKLCRWLVPLAMLAALAANTALAGRDPFYLTLWIGQCAFYGLALAGLAGGRWLPRRLLRLPSFFVLVNASIAHAWYRYARGDRMLIWTPSRR
jgi:cellulose synthase/poly-beta-1,6-N-acetylglucosamine synthase-like glycosyltransferase